MTSIREKEEVSRFMREAIHFSFGSFHSKDFGVILTNTNSGLFEDIFLPSTRIIEKNVSSRDKPYFQGVVRDPISFPLTLFIEDYSKKGKLREIARWLFTDYYQPLIFESNPDRVFYAMIEGESNWYHTGTKTGYIDINVRCDSPYSYTPEYSLDDIKFSNSNQEYSVVNQFNDFQQGTHINTEVTSNGLTVKDAPEKWKDVYPMYRKWGDINGK